MRCRDAENGVKIKINEKNENYEMEAKEKKGKRKIKERKPGKWKREGKRGRRRRWNKRIRTIRERNTEAYEIDCEHKHKPRNM